MLRAVIMAGGTGSRLRPLTCDLPKPMARLCGRPNLAYILDLLEEHHVSEAAVTLRYLPQRITEAFPDGHYHGIALRFVEETEPLGTAGSVNNVARQYDDDFIVISGDAMCDFDLTAALAHHRKCGAAATLVVKAVDDPREYGLVQATPDGFVAAFVEKPGYSQAVSSLANTGVYILSPRALSPVPARTAWDFAQNLFPRLLEMGETLAVYEDHGYWCDIGDIDAYRRCQQDMLHGRVRCRIEGERDADGNIFCGGRPHGAYVLHSPVYIGERVEIGTDAVLEAGTVVDEGCTIGANTRITGSVLLQDSMVSPDAALTGAVICAGASVQRGAMLFENAVLGAGAVAGAQCVVRPGVRVWAEKQVEPGVTLRENLKYASAKAPCFEEDGLSGAPGVELTPELAVRIGLAVGSLAAGTHIGVASSGERACKVLRQALIAGVLSSGADVLDFGACSDALFRFNVSFCGLRLGVMIEGDDPAYLRLVTTGGLPATRAQERAVEGALQRGEYTRRMAAQFGEVCNLSGMRVLYETELLKFAPRGLSGIGVRVKCANRELELLLSKTLERLGAHREDGFVLQLAPSGNAVSLSLAGVGYLPHSKALALVCEDEFQHGHPVALPFDAPRALDTLAQRHNMTPQRYLNCPADQSDHAARDLAASQLWSRDALMLSIKLLAGLQETGQQPNSLFLRLPAFETATAMVRTGRNPARILQRLGGSQQSGHAIGEGIVLCDTRGTILVRPLKRGGALQLVAEAASAEIAMELCANWQRMLGPLAQGDEKRTDSSDERKNST